ncbi:MAG: hypothetical protein ACXV4C_07035 [Halobacteriota archaeon]
MTKDTHKKDKKLHNSGDNDLSSEAIDLPPENEGESGTEIYYFTGEDGHTSSHE